MKAVPRSILKLERDYIAPIATADAVIKAGTVVDEQSSNVRHASLHVSLHRRTMNDPTDFDNPD